MGQEDYHSPPGRLGSENLGVPSGALYFSCMNAAETQRPWVLVIDDESTCTREPLYAKISMTENDESRPRQR